MSQTGGLMLNRMAVAVVFLAVLSLDTHGQAPGTKRWEFDIGGSVNGCAPAIAPDGTIYIGSNGNKLYAVNPDGTKKWEWDAGDDLYFSPSIGSDGTIYVTVYNRTAGPIVSRRPGTSVITVSC